MSDNVETIRGIYDALGRGDVQFILDSVTGDVDWMSDTASRGAPWCGPRAGRDGVASFFQALGESVTIEEFEPLVYAAAGEDVLTIVKYTHTSRATGKSASMHLHHWFRFRDGKIAYCRSAEDAVQTEAILR